MENTISLIKAISSLIWPICLLLIVFMFRRELQSLLLSLLPKKKDEHKTVGDKPPETQISPRSPAEFEDVTCKTATDEFITADQLTIEACKHKDTGKYFVVLRENDEKIYSITPEGKLKDIEKKFLQKIEEISADVLGKEQLEALYWWIQNTQQDELGLVTVNDRPKLGYLPSYIRMLKNPDTEPSRMLRYIKSSGKVSWAETKKYLHDTYGYELASGSMGASLKALEALDLVTISGQGDTKMIT